MPRSSWTLSRQPETRHRPDPDRRLPVTAVVGMAWLFLGLAPPVARAETFCRLMPPEVRRDGNALELAVTLGCRDAAEAGFLSYPTGQPIYIGASLFQAEGGEVDVQVRDDAGGVGLPFATLEAVADGASVVLRLDEAPEGMTHFVVAAWLEQVECTWCEGPVGLGPIDKDLFPMPLDTYPRPHCDVDALEAIGYFDWASTGDPSGFVAPDEIADVFHDVDCFRRFPDGPGLGLSLKAWRAAPLPAP